MIQTNTIAFKPNSQPIGREDAGPLRIQKQSE